MKKYLLLLTSVALLAASCSERKSEQQKNAEASISKYVKSHIQDAKSYESKEFSKLDSVKWEDTKLYKSIKDEKEKQEKAVSSTKEKIEKQEKSTSKDSQQILSDLKSELQKEEMKLTEARGKLNRYETKGKESVYSIKHKYKAKKESDKPVMEYEEIFYIDRYGNVIEVFED